MNKDLIQSLNEALTSTYALMALTHAAHWNVEGPGFFELHKAFGEQYESLLGAADEIAEQIRKLGSYALPRMEMLANAINGLPPLSESTDLVRPIIEANLVVLTKLNEAKEIATKQNDLETQNLMIDRVDAHLKTLWMLRAYSHRA